MNSYLLKLPGAKHPDGYINIADIIGYKGDFPNLATLENPLNFTGQAQGWYHGTGSNLIDRAYTSFMAWHASFQTSGPTYAWLTFESPEDITAWSVRIGQFYAPSSMEIYRIPGVGNVTDPEDPRWELVLDKSIWGYMNTNTLLSIMTPYVEDKVVMFKPGDGVVTAKHVFYVDLENGSEFNDGLTPQTPVQSLDEVFNKNKYLIGGNYLALEDIAVLYSGTGTDTITRNVNDCFNMKIICESPLKQTLHFSNGFANAQASRIEIYRATVTDNDYLFSNNDVFAERVFFNCHIKTNSQRIVSGQSARVNPEIHYSIIENLGTTYLFDAPVDIYDSLMLGFFDGSTGGTSILVRTWHGSTYYLLRDSGQLSWSGVDPNYTYNPTDLTLTSGFDATNGSIGLYFGDYRIDYMYLLQKLYYLFIGADGNSYRFNGTAMELVSTGTPTEADFISSGMLSLKNINSTEIAAIDPDLITGIECWLNYAAPTDTINVKEIQYKSKGLAKQATPINLAGFASLSGLDIQHNLTAPAQLKAIVSIDGLNWKAYSAGWVDVTAPLVTDAGADTLLAEGSDLTVFNGLSSTDWDALVGTSDTLYFAFAFESAVNGTSEILELQISVNGVGDWVKDYQTTIKLRGNEFVFIPTTTDTYKVNYQDN